ncbi:hypothetical protein Tco_0025917 [Tanacetum coccineum]
MEFLSLMNFSELTPLGVGLWTGRTLIRGLMYLAFKLLSKLKEYHQRVIHQRKYPQWVSSSEVVSVLNHQQVCSSAGKLMLQDTERKKTLG